MKWSPIVSICPRPMTDWKKCMSDCTCRGFRIGTKIVDEFMRDSTQPTCSKLKDLADRFCTVPLC